MYTLIFFFSIVASYVGNRLTTQMGLSLYLHIYAFYQSNLFFHITFYLYENILHLQNTKEKKVIYRCINIVFSPKNVSFIISYDEKKGRNYLVCFFFRYFLCSNSHLFPLHIFKQTLFDNIYIWCEVLQHIEFLFGELKLYSIA